MQSSKTILVPVDFEAASLEALATARALAPPLGLEVVLAHVYTIPVAVYPGFGPVISAEIPEQIATAAKSALDKLAADAGGLRSILRSGDPVTEILKIIEETGPTFVAMGTHGRKGLSRMLIGSTAERIVRLCPAPVLTVHARER